MLVLTRKYEQWVEITHPKSGDVMHVRVMKGRGTGQVRLVFDDEPHNFKMDRPERVQAEREAS